jgi:hypothetical protein
MNLMIKKIDNKDPLFQEALAGIKDDIRLTLKLLSFCFLLALFVKFVFKVEVSLVVFIILLIWTLFYLSHSYFIKEKKNKEDLAVFHFKNTIIDILLLTVVIHYFGGVEWLGGIFYVAILAWTSNILLKKQGLVLALLAVCFYASLVLLEYFQILPHRDAFGFSSGFYQNPGFVFVQILVLTSGLFFIAENYGNFSEVFRKKQEKLIEAQEQVEEAKAVLEIKVRARTRELKELSNSLESQVKERTKEIQEKMKELEKFQKLAVNRELRMVELKQKINELEKKTKKPRKILKINESRINKANS